MFLGSALLGFARSTTTFRFSENAIRENTGPDGRGAVNANHRLTLLSRTPLLDAASEKFDPIATLSSYWRESHQPAWRYIAALSAGKARFESNVTRRIESKRLAGGGGGIRTPETLAGLTVFKTGAFNHSATPPLVIVAHAGILGLISDRALRSGWEGGCALLIWIPRSIPVGLR
jgi:hypothetical protein